MASLSSHDDLKKDADRLAHKLQQSRTREEALETTIQAAENALRLLAITSDVNEKAKYRARAKQLMGEAESIKKNPNWGNPAQVPAAASIATGSAKQPGSGDRLTATTTIPRTEADLKHVRVLKEPCSTRALTTREKIILARATFLNGVKFPAWEKDPLPEEFELRPGEELFLDESSELPLSDFQLDVLDDWKRPADALPPPSWIIDSTSTTSTGPTMTMTQDMDLVQDASTDCSVVASLSAGAARVRRGHAKLMRSVFYPWDTIKDEPVMSRNGKYILRMNFNGCFRKVVIDDRIPVSATKRVIHVVDRNNPGLVWPALVEKAYLKIRGGYDFPGSNSGTDIWILTGWIPEQVHLQEADLDLDRFWRRIANAFSYGDVVITMGTGKMSKKTERALGLAGEHDYAVLDLREIDGQHLMLIKNPWVDGVSWSGRRSSIPSDSQLVASPRDLLNGDEKLKPGSFWMDLDNITQHFESIYLNWNPGLFSHREDLHFEWDLSPSSTDNNNTHHPRGVSTSLHRNRQFCLTPQTHASTIWILLSRHFQNYVPESATADEIESGRHFIDLNGHITLAAFSSHGKRVMLSDRHLLLKGNFIDSPQTLLKLESCTPKTPLTIVPLESDLSSTKHTFTLSCFSNSPLSLTPALPRYPHSISLSSSWTADSSGGNASTGSYCSNPQFTLSLSHPTTSLALLLESHNSKFQVNLKLLHSAGGQRLYRIRNRDIILDSKEYRAGACMAEMEGLPAGKYTVICSTFDTGQIGEFGLLVESEHPVGLVQLPREGAGRVRTEMGMVEFEMGRMKMAVKVDVVRVARVYARVCPVGSGGSSPSAAGGAATSGGSTPRSHIRIRLLLSPSSSPSHTHTRTHSLSTSATLATSHESETLATSHEGEYASGMYAVRTDEIMLSPEIYRRGAACWLVIERMFVPAEMEMERFAVEVLADQVDAVRRGGEWVSWEGEEG